MTLKDISESDDYPYNPIDNPDPENPSGCWPEELLQAIAKKQEESYIRDYIKECSCGLDGSDFQDMKKGHPTKEKKLIKKQLNKPTIRTIQIPG
jgi:hypothetical protein